MGLVRNGADARLFGFCGELKRPQPTRPLEYAFEEHAAPGRPPLYEYRPLVRGYVERRERNLALLEDASIALAEIVDAAREKLEDRGRSARSNGAIMRR